MTKEEILDSIILDWATPVKRMDCYEAMDEHSKQECIEFGKWIMVIPFLSRHGNTTEQLYDIYLQSKKTHFMKKESNENKMFALIDKGDKLMGKGMVAEAKKFYQEAYDIAPAGFEKDSLKQILENI